MLQSVFHKRKSGIMYRHDIHSVRKFRDSKNLSIMKYSTIKWLIALIIFLVLAITLKTVIAEHNIDCSIAIDEKSCTNNYRDYISLYDWDIDIAYAIMMAESRGDKNVVNPEAHRGCKGSSGLFQVACVHDDVEKLKDARYNISKAYEIYQESGWKPWGAYSSKSFQKFL